MYCKNENFVLLLQHERKRGPTGSLLYCKNNTTASENKQIMIQQNTVRQIVNDYLTNTKYILIDLRISPQNEIYVEIDSYEGVDVDFCAELSNHIQSQLNRDIEDYELEVGSVSLTAPFKTKMQYEKNLGHEVEVLTCEGKKLKGMLVEVNDNNFKVDVEEMVRVEGKKRRQKQINTLTFLYSEVKHTTYLLKF